MTTSRLALGVLGLCAIPIVATLVILHRGASTPGTSRPATSTPPPRPQSPLDTPRLPADDAGPLARARALAQRDPAESRRVLRSALAANPDDAKLVSALARKLLLDESLEAKHLAARCVELTPSDASCQDLYRRALDPAPRDDPTSKFLDDCLASDDDRAPCLAGVVVERLRAGDVAGAAKATEHLQKAAPDDPLARLSRARVLSAQGKYGAALEVFAAACEAGQSYACFRAEALRADGW